MSNNTLIVKETGSGTAEPIPEGVYTAICYAVVDIGTQYSERWDNASRKVVVTWEIPELRIDLERVNKRVNLPRAISKRFSQSLHEKSIMRRDLAAWRGKAFTEEELEGFDLQKIIAAGCQLQIIHTSRDGKTYANVGSIMALPKGVTTPKLENEPLFFSFDGLSEPTLPDGIPDWIVKLIKQSREWAKLTTAGKGSSNESDAKTELKAIPVGVDGDEDDDVPF